MTIKEFNDQSFYCAEVLFLDPGSVVPREGLLALLVSDLHAIAKRGHSTAIAQLFGLALPGTILSRHVFQGLKRPLYTDGNINADAEKLIYTRKPAFDCIWSGGPQDGLIKRTAPPSGCVFAVYVSPNIKHKQSFPDVDGWINYCTWIEEDQALSEAPTDWVGRYTRKLWTR